MTDEPSLQARLAILEAAVNRPGAGGWRGGFVLLCLILLTVNAWLAFRYWEAERSRGREHLFWLVCHPGAGASQRADAFLRLVAAGNTEWRSARLSHLDLRAADLRGADLQHARFENSDLSSADLSGANLSGGDLQLARLTEADLSRSNLVETNFLKADLQQANLREARLMGASLEQCDAREAHFALADLTDANLLMADFSGANLTGATLEGANLQAAVFRRANLWLAVVEEAELQDADFSDSNWWRARGFSSDALAELTKKFPPSPNAEPSRRNDFQLWLKSRRGKKNAADDR